jgi:hypothetical protein
MPRSGFDIFRSFISKDWCGAFQKMLSRDRSDEPKAVDSPADRAIGPTAEQLRDWTTVLKRFVFTKPLI